MRTLPYAIALFAALSLIGLAGAAGANAQMNGYLSQFLPQSVINSSTVINQSVGSNTYSMYEIKGNTFVIVNTTNAPNHYSVVLSNASIHSIISSYIFGKYYSNGLFNNLTTYVDKFTAAANHGFASCISAIQANNNSSVVVANGVANFTGQYHGDVVNAWNGEHVLYSEKLNPAGGGRIVEWLRPALTAIVFNAADIRES